LKISRKIAKKFKKLKNIIPALFPSKPGIDRTRNREKKNCPEFHFYPTWARNFQQK